MHVYGELIGNLKSSGHLSGFLNAQIGRSGVGGMGFTSFLKIHAEENRGFYSPGSFAFLG